MIGATQTPSTCNQFELEIPIDASRENVWNAIFEDVNSWWVADFHMMGPDSIVTFDPTPGGNGLIEKTSDGGALLWYEVQMVLPADFKIYLVGHIAPEWGGPTISSLKLSLVESKNGCVFQISDARHGNVDDAQLSCSKDGWQQLFGDGLKKFVESGNT